MIISKSKMKQVVIQSGSKQYFTSLGKIIKVEKISAKEGDIIDFNDLLTGEKISAKVLETSKDKKIRIFKFKNKTGYKKTRGHRQLFTKIEVINPEIITKTDTPKKSPKKVTTGK